MPTIKPSEIPNTITNPTPSSTPTSQNEQANIISLKSREDSSKPVSLSSSKSISSCVGAVINRREDIRPSRHESRRDDRRDYDHDEDDEEGDSRRSGGLSSVIKVSDRKYAVPKSMQPNKSILLRAVDAANTSVSVRTKSIADEKLEQIRSKRLSEPSSSKPIVKTTNVNRIELFTQHHDRDDERDHQAWVIIY
jgi:hypothetical protein